LAGFDLQETARPLLHSTAVNQVEEVQKAKARWCPPRCPAKADDGHMIAGASQETWLVGVAKLLLDPAASLVGSLTDNEANEQLFDAAQRIPALL
jgi:hypothetical protein